MKTMNWATELDIAITVCDDQGTILEMNEKAFQTFAADGGRELIGKNILDCHPPAAKTKLEEMMHSGIANRYTIEKNGVKKLIYQTPWFKNGTIKGFVEIALPIPFDMPHFIRT